VHRPWQYANPSDSLRLVSQRSDELPQPPILLKECKNANANQVLFRLYSSSDVNPTKQYCGYIKWVSSEPGLDHGRIELCVFDVCLGEDELHLGGLGQRDTLRYTRLPGDNPLLKAILAIHRPCSEGAELGNHSVYFQTSGAQWTFKTATIRKAEEMVCTIVPYCEQVLAQQQNTLRVKPKRTWSRLNGDLTAVIGEHGAVGTASNAKSSPVSRDSFQEYIAATNLVQRPNGWLRFEHGELFVGEPQGKLYLRNLVLSDSTIRGMSCRFSYGF
jgi:hypothetical protein